VKTAVPSVSGEAGGKEKTAAPQSGGGTQALKDPGKGEEGRAAVRISIAGPQDKGVILDAVTVDIKPGDTVMDILKRVTREKKIQMEVTGAKATAYVKGIDNIYEFDYGAKSGWIYRVNGTVPKSGAGVYGVKGGDVIEWLYTVDLGKEYEAGIGGT
jgi:hypothetical protein